MKKIARLTAIVPFVAGFLGAGCAHQQSAVDPSNTYPNSTNGAYVTGSYLPQDVTRNGPVTNGKSDVRIIDQSDINRSGGANVGQSLRQLGVTH
jgi:uncharacterized lipoprotein YajG